jgi:hypothetical protein
MFSLSTLSLVGVRFYLRIGCGSYTVHSHCLLVLQSPISRDSKGCKLGQAALLACGYLTHRIVTLELDPGKILSSDLFLASSPWYWRPSSTLSSTHSLAPYILTIHSIFISTLVLISLLLYLDLSISFTP